MLKIVDFFSDFDAEIEYKSTLNYANCQNYNNIKKVIKDSIA